MPTIQLYFMGVAVHLFGTVPGVPCRVVLPDATASYLYEDRVLDRHFTALQWQTSDGTYNKVPFFRQVFSVGNPVMGQDFVIDPSIAGLYPLERWVNNLQLSSEVVFAGRTALCFDIYYGTLKCHQMVNGALYTSLTVEVEDDPYLLRVPFHYASYDTAPAPEKPVRWMWPADTEHVAVTNSGDGCRGSKDDFALSFLVTRGGIPRGLTDLPGQDPTTQDPTTAGDAPTLFANHDATVFPSVLFDSLSAACSASSFPKVG